MPLTISSDDRSVEWDFCLIFAPLRATMSQKSSLPQAANSVSRVLMTDSSEPCLREGRSGVCGTWLGASRLWCKHQKKPSTSELGGLSDDSAFGTNCSCVRPRQRNRETAPLSQF